MEINPWVGLPYDPWRGPNTLFVVFTNLLVSGSLAAAYRYAMYANNLDLRFMVFRLLMVFLLSLVWALAIFSLIIANWILGNVLGQSPLFETYLITVLLSLFLLSWAVAKYLDLWLIREVKKLWRGRRTKFLSKCDRLKENTFIQMLTENEYGTWVTFVTFMGFSVVSFIVIQGLFTGTVTLIGAVVMALIILPLPTAYQIVRELKRPLSQLVLLQQYELECDGSH
jgi:hypothetical protein